MAFKKRQRTWRTGGRTSSEHRTKRTSQLPWRGCHQEVEEQRSWEWRQRTALIKMDLKTMASCLHRLLVRIWDSEQKPEHNSERGLQSIFLDPLQPSVVESGGFCWKLSSRIRDGEINGRPDQIRLIKMSMYGARSARCCVKISVAESNSFESLR